MTDIPDEAVEAAAGVRATIKTGYGEYAGPIGEDIARRALTAAAPIIAAQATADLRAEIEKLRDAWERFGEPGQGDRFYAGYSKACRNHADDLDALLGGA